MLRSMSIRQFQEWRYYADLEPFDEERADLRAGSIVMAIRNSWRKRGGPLSTLKDSTLKFVQPEITKTPEQARAEIKNTMDILVQIFNTEQSASDVVVEPSMKRIKR